VEKRWLPFRAADKNLPAGLLTWIQSNGAPSRLASVACCTAHPPYSVGHVADFHRLPDSPLSAGWTAPGDTGPIVTGEAMLWRVDQAINSCLRWHRIQHFASQRALGCPGGWRIFV